MERRMIISITLYLIIIIVFTKCTRNVEKTYYPTGELKSMCTPISQNRCDCIEYEKNGKIKYNYELLNNDSFSTKIYFNTTTNNLITSIENIKDSIYVGDKIIFSNSNNVQSVEHYDKNRLLGDNVYFQKNKSLSKWVRNKLIRDTSLVNEWLFFDKDANISLQHSNFFSVKSSYDTISITETFNFKVILSAPFFGDNFYVVYGDFDDNFKLKDINDVDTIIGKNECGFFTSYKEFKPQKLGVNVIRGIAYDIGYKSNDVVERREFYIECTYFAK